MAQSLETVGGVFAGVNMIFRYFEVKVSWSKPKEPNGLVPDLIPQLSRSRSSDQRAMASDLRLFHALGLEPPNHRFLMQLNSNTAEMCEHPRATVVTEGNGCRTDAALASPDQNQGATVTTVASIAVPSVTRTTARSHERKSRGTKSREW